MRRLLAAVLWLSAAFPLSAAAAPKAPAAREKKTVDASFECSLPSDWYLEKKDDGVTALGPRDENRVAAQISIRYIPKGHPYYDSVESFIARATQPDDIPMPGWKVGSPETVTVAGRKSRRLVNENSEFVPPNSLNTKEVPMREEHVAVPAARGFYLLTYYAPASLYAAHRKTFAHALATFKPKL